MKRFLWSWILTMVLVTGGFAHVSFAQNNEIENKKDSNIIKISGFEFNVAADRKIIKNGAYYEPEGLEFYFKRLFDELNGTIKKLSAKIDELEAEIKSLETALLSSQEVKTS